MGGTRERAVARGFLGRVDPRDFAAPPNVVSLARIALVPVVLALLAVGARLGAALVIVVAAASDGLDGALARKTGRVTELGKILDPLADKIAIDAVLLALLLRGEFPGWALALVLARDLGIGAGALALAGRTSFVPQAIVPGKVALVLLSAMVTAYAADLRVLEPSLLAAGVAGVVVSGAAYVAVLGRELRKQTAGVGPSQRST